VIAQFRLSIQTAGMHCSLASAIYHLPRQRPHGSIEGNASENSRRLCVSGQRFPLITIFQYN
jgi:hypothetical protein